MNPSHRSFRDPPQAIEKAYRHNQHGVPRDDPWHWLTNRDDQKVVEYLEEENTYTDAVMAPHKDTADQLYKDLIGRIEESHVSAPYIEGDWIYQSRIEKGQDYHAYYRKPVDGSGDWQLLIDGNKKAEGLVYFEIGFLQISPDGRRMAYTIDSDGSERYTLKFRDLETGTDLPDEFPEVGNDGEWDASSNVFFLVLEDETRRPDRILRHRIGSEPEMAEVVYTESDSLFFAGLYKSQDGQYLFASSESSETTEVHYVRSDSPEDPFTCLFPRRENIQYWIEHHEGKWLVRSNENAPDFKLLQVNMDAPDLAKAEVLIPANPEVRLEDILVFKDYWVTFERSKGIEHMRVHELASGETHRIEIEDSVYELEPMENAEYDTAFLNFAYSSPIRPSSFFRYNLQTRERELLRSVEVPSGHDPGQYTVYRTTAPSHDGVEVPLTICHRRDLPRDGSRPAYIYGYGAYGSIVDANFRTSWLTWLERGYTVAIAHVRGGGLLGEEWYQKGKFQYKKNSFLDFVGCANALVREHYTSPGNIIIEGGSAGGLLMGAVLNLQPDLFKAAVARVPFVDVLNTMFDASLPLTTFEYEEWGNPDEKHIFDVIRDYAPYENVQEAAYPALLATAGLNDPRVPYWEAAKWVARLRRHHIGNSPILLKTNMEAGHGGASGRYEYWKELAFEQAFLLAEWPAGGPPHPI